MIVPGTAIRLTASVTRKRDTKDEKAWRRKAYLTVRLEAPLDALRVHVGGGYEGAVSEAIASRRPYILEIPTTNDPAPITGTWDVIDLYKRAADARAGQEAAR